jgi:glycosyltransferase involved in cell wall biosynthesis
LAKWLGYIDKLGIFPLEIRKELSWPDVIHICDCANAFLAVLISKKPVLITCNDLLAVRCAMGEFKEYRTGLGSRVLSTYILKGLETAAHIACISIATKNDILRITGATPDKVSIIYMGLNYEYSPMGKEESSIRLEHIGYNTKNKFFLHVGKNSWYKNRIGVLEIFRQIVTRNKTENYCLVFAGKDLPEEMRAFIDRNGLNWRVFSFAAPDNEDLRALYSSAAALIYPSIAEGFGWPIIEAQACGCPVFATDRQPMTEAGGDAAVYFNPDDPEEAASIIIEGIKNSNQMRDTGFANVKRFSVKRMAADYVSIYKKLSGDK